jgi:hypothetical protein
MLQSAPRKTAQVRFKPTTLRLLAQLCTKTGLHRNDVIRYAIVKLAEREGIPTVDARSKLSL